MRNRSQYLPLCARNYEGVTRAKRTDDTNVYINVDAFRDTLICWQKQKPTRIESHTHNYFRNFDNLYADL